MRALPVRLLLGWVTFHLVFSWLPLVRCVMDGESYAWGTSHFGHMFHSRGLERPDVWLLVFKSALFGTLIYLGARGAGRLFQWLILLWTLVLTADVTYAVATNPKGMEFHGDTLGLHFNMGWVLVPVVGAFALLALWWVVRERRAGRETETPPWTAANRKLLLICLLLLPVQFVLLRFGEPHGLTDKIGVLLTILQCPLFTFALWPRNL